MPVEEGIQLFTKKLYNSWVMDNTFTTLPFGQIMLKENADRNKEGKDIGIPVVNGVISGNRGLNASNLITLATAEEYLQDFHTTYTDNSKVMGERDSTPTYANSTTDAPELHYGNAAWRRFRLVTPLICWKSSKDAAASRRDLSESDRNRAVLDTFGNVIKETTGVHTRNIGLRLYTGNPTNQDASKWDDVLGITQVCSASNTYARLNRSTTSNIQWRGNVNSTPRAASLKDIVDYAIYSLILGNGTTGGLQALGRQNKVKAAFAPPAIFQQWKNEAQTNGGQILKSDQVDIGKFGFTGDVVQYGNTIGVCDQNLPSGNVFLFDPQDFTVAFEKGKQMMVSRWRYEPDYRAGAQEFYTAEQDSSLFFICHNPVNPVLFTAVS